MKRKKIFAVLMLTVMSLSSAACVGVDKTSSEDLSANTETQEETFITSEIPPLPNEARDIELESFSSDAMIEETVLVDENDVKITATGLSYTDYSVGLNLLIENNSDRDLSFVSGSLGYSCNAVNGYMVDNGYLNADVSAGKKANETISFSIQDLSIYGITEIADIQVGFDISDADYNHTYSGPRQVRTSAADSYDYDADTYRISVNSGRLESAYNCSIDYYAEDELYDQNGIRITSEALVTNRDGEKALLLEIENQSSDYVNSVAADISLNGLVVYSGAWSGDSVNPGTRRIMDLSISSMLDEVYWEMFGISDIGDVTWTFKVQDSEYNDMTEPQEITITVSEAAASFDGSGDELYDENGIRFVSKGLVEDSFEYSDDIHMLLLVENDSSGTVDVDDVYDSLSINGFMTDYIAFGTKIPSGKSAVIDVEIQSSSLERNNIIGIEGITEAEISFKIRDDDYNLIADPKLSIVY